jgi:hypothetical protein
MIGFTKTEKQYLKQAKQLPKLRLVFYTVFSSKETFLKKRTLKKER